MGDMIPIINFIFRNFEKPVIQVPKQKHGLHIEFTGKLFTMVVQLRIYL